MISSSEEIIDAPKQKEFSPNKLGEALVFQYPEMYIDNLNQSDFSSFNDEPLGTYCAFCGRFLSESTKIDSNCQNQFCRAVCNVNTTSDDIINGLLGKFPKRSTPLFNK